MKLSEKKRIIVRFSAVLKNYKKNGFGIAKNAKPFDENS